MHEPPRKRPVFSRLLLLALFAALAGATGLAAVGGGAEAGAAMQQGTVVVARNLLFEDRSDGAVVVREAGSQVPLEVMEGENGFLRGTLRGFARSRRGEQVGRDVPFRLAKWSDGRLTLDDPATGRHVELLAFGPSNAGVFAKLLGVSSL